MEKTVCELFAGVGGFRVGLENASKEWNTVWFSQWEPGKKKQWAHDCYVRHFGNSIDNDGLYTTGIDIAEVKKESIPNHNLLVGGFPCQDYSVAHPLSTSMGLEGKKGVLWWQIYDTIIAKNPPFCLFENVDRLLKSPASQRGRDFGVILSCLNQLGYSVEWRVINAALYGAAQRRRRTFIFAWKNTTNYANKYKSMGVADILDSNGFFSTCFPVKPITDYKSIRKGTLSDSVYDVSDSFRFSFENAGYMSKGFIYTSHLFEVEEQPTTLRQVLQSNVPEKYYITQEKMPKWTYLKGAKKISRTSSNGHEYTFSEGAIAFPDPWDKPSRTMLTSESTLNRSTHVVMDPETKQLRLLTPTETERLQGFPDDWTNTGMPERFRYFCMGNALVVSMITRMGKQLNCIFEAEG